MKPTQRELVFDIDMTDYDDVRTCCSGADVCTKCWKFMTIACRILDVALRGILNNSHLIIINQFVFGLFLFIDDFGYEHILWVFSGRRGIHCWVCDKSARHLDNKSRAAVAEYLQITSTSTEGVFVRIGDKMHHSVRRAFRVIEPLFEEIILNDQNLFGSAEGITKLLKMLPDENVRKDLEPKLRVHENDSKGVWNTFTKYILSMRGQGPHARLFRNTCEEIQLALLYPRLDINVSKGMNHLLKAPFCVHPKTGKVCVPFNLATVQKFDPTNVPTITQLLEEINTFDEKNKIEENTVEDKLRIKV